MPRPGPSNPPLALALLLFSRLAPAQIVILHLRNGDHIAGTITSEQGFMTVLLYVGAPVGHATHELWVGSTAPSG